MASFLDTHPMAARLHADMKQLSPLTWEQVEQHHHQLLWNACHEAGCGLYKETFLLVGGMSFTLSMGYVVFGGGLHIRTPSKEEMIYACWMLLIEPLAPRDEHDLFTAYKQAEPVQAMNEITEYGF